MADQGLDKLDALPNRSGRHGYRGRLAILALLIILSPAWAALSVAADKPDSNVAPASFSIFKRQPLGFDSRTVEHIAAGSRNLPDEVPKLIEFLGHQRRALGHSGVILMLLLAVAIGYGIFGRVQLARRVMRAFASLSERIPYAGQEWLAALSEVVAATLVPISLWGLWAFVRALTGFHGPLFMFGGQFLLAWTVYSFALSVVRELVMRPLLPIPAEHGRYIFRFSRLLLAYGIALKVCTYLIADFGAPADIVALIDAALRLSLIVMLAIVTVRRRAVVALFPDLPNFLYRGFVTAFTRFYPAVWALTVGIALIQLAGFVALANFLWARTWLPAGLFLLAVMLNHISERALHRTLLSANAQRENAINLYRSLSRLVKYTIALATIACFTSLIGAFGPVFTLLAQPVITIGNQNVSIVVLGKAILIVVLFALSGRLIRDYCEFRIYPQLNIDPGVANAINTFIVYVVVAIGVLASVEAVGLGLGTITLFAGAFGIGLGMGLQSMANNLTSGLTLIFSRALRKGDVVTTGETLGIIQEVGIRATRMKTPDAIEYLVPNSEFVDGKLVNWTRSDPYTRVHVPIGVSYDAAPEVVRRIMEEVAARTPNVQPQPPPEVRFASLGDSSLNFELLLWINVKEVQPERVRSDLYFGLFRALKEAGIEIPFPQRDIHIRSSEVFIPERKRT
ncbi:MAG: mechanosensitive ion channel family protein [Candidatus Binataceae bacterium]